MVKKSIVFYGYKVTQKYLNPRKNFVFFAKSDSFVTIQ